jgi:CDP-paratose synthetase
MSTNKILITGGTGFLGSNLIKALLSQGNQLAVLKRKSSKLQYLESVLPSIKTFNIEEISIEDCLKSFQPEIVIHCATDYGRTKNSTSSIVETNLLLPLRILELCKENGVKLFLNTDTSLDKDTNVYSRSKKQFKEWFETYAASLCCVNVTLEHFYGPFDDKSKFVSFLFNKFTSNESTLDLTEGKQKRDFIYIDDVIEAYLLVLKTHREFNAGFYNYNVGSGESVEVRELVLTIQKVTKNSATQINFGAIPYREHEVMETHVDLTEIKKLGWKPQHSLAEGLSKMYETEQK